MLVKLILEQYVPLLSSGIEKVELSLSHMITLFISKNGAGKTAVLKEVNPFPPENGSYEEGGRKYYEEIIGANHYILDSYTGKGNGHSFLLNGKELNPNGTYLGQKELVEKHWQLSVGMNRVLNGLRTLDLLSAMSPTRRKDILMEVYPNNTDYALGVFNKLRIERNGLKATIKNQLDRYTEENRKLKEIAEVGTESLELRIKGIDEELKESLLVRGSLEQFSTDPNMDSNIAKFNRLVDQLSVNKLVNNVHTLPEIESALDIADSLYWHHHDQANALKTLIAENSSGLEGMEDLLKDPEKYAHQAKSNEQDILNVSTEIDECKELLKDYPVFNDPSADCTHLEQITETFTSHLHRTELVSDGTLTGNQYKKYTVDQEFLSNSVRREKETLADMVHKLAHYENAETLECPECKHGFKVGVSPQDIISLKAQRDVLIEKIAKDEAHLEDLTTKVNRDADWFMGMNQLFRFVRENGHVNTLPQLVKDYDVGKVEPSRLINGLSLYTKLHGLQEKRKLFLEEQQLIETRIGLLDKSNLKFVAEYIANLEKDLVIEDNKIAFYKRKMESLKRNKNQINSYNQDLIDLKDLRENILEALGDGAKVSLRRRVDQRINLLSEEKEDYMVSLIKNRSLTAVVSSISDDINRMKRRVKIIDVWMDSLCPNKGIIGRLMGDFIRKVCNSVNVVLKQVWDTPLLLKPCSKDNGDLNYRFPVVVGEGKPNPDVSECSAGERDIIDWTFRFVLLGYHPNYPLFMDEVGVRLDEIKQSRFFNFVHQYTQEKSPRQLFLVSHYMAQYGLFKNPNIVALRYEGLTLTGEVNLDSIIT